MPVRERLTATTRFRVGVVASGVLVIPLFARLVSDRIFPPSPLAVVDATSPLVAARTITVDDMEGARIFGERSLPAARLSADTVAIDETARPSLTRSMATPSEDDPFLRDFTVQTAGCFDRNACGWPCPCVPGGDSGDAPASGWSTPSGSDPLFAGDPSRVIGGGGGLAAGYGGTGAGVFALATVAAVAAGLATAEALSSHSTTTVILGSVATGSQSPNPPEPVVVSP